jgi:hypothetical protein
MHATTAVDGSNPTPTQGRLRRRLAKVALVLTLAGTAAPLVSAHPAFAFADGSVHFDKERPCCGRGK